MIELTEEQRILINTIEEFAKRKIEPIAKKIDEEDHIPESLYKDMKEQGLMAIQVSPEYGGAGLDTLTYVHILEIIGKHSGGLGLSLEAHNSLGLEHINKFGTRDLKYRILPGIVESGKPVAWALTEPQAGSDAKNMATIAEKHKDSFILNGSKMFITHGISADYIVVMAKTSPGYSAFVVDSKESGLSKTKLKDKLGVRGSDTAELVFENVEVPAENLIGEVGEGYKQALAILDGGRVAISALGVGIAQGCLNLITDYVKQRKAFNQYIYEFQGIQFYVSEIATEIQGARLLTHNAAVMRDKNMYYKKEAAMAKYFSSQVAMKASRLAIQIYGGYGYFREFGVDRYYRDAKLLEIGEGTNEIQKILIAKEVLK